ALPWSGAAPPATGFHFWRRFAAPRSRARLRDRRLERRRRRPIDAHRFATCRSSLPPAIIERLTRRTAMKFPVPLAGCFVLVATFVAADPAVKTIGFDDLHIRVPDPAKAGAWYVEHLGATPTQSPHRVSFGRTLIIFTKDDNAGPSTVIDHF